MDNRTEPRFAPRQHAGAGAVPKAGSRFDAGLRKHMLRVYNYMASGVLLTGIVALLTYSSGLMYSFFTPTGPNLFGWIVMLAPLGFILAMTFGLNRMSEGTLQMVFWAFATVMGLSLSTIFATYTGGSIAQVFFVTAIAFGSLSLWGYTTKKDLGPMGTFLFMGLIGIIVASIANIFFASGTLSLVISVLGVLIFAGLTAYDTQRIKNEYFQLQGTSMIGKAAIMGATSLYLDFINMFLMLLRLFGSRD